MRLIIDAMTIRYYCLRRPELEAPVVPTASRGVVDRQMSEDNTRTQPLIAALRYKRRVSDCRC